MIGVRGRPFNRWSLVSNTYGIDIGVQPAAATTQSIGSFSTNSHTTGIYPTSYVCRGAILDQFFRLTLLRFVETPIEYAYDFHTNYEERFSKLGLFESPEVDFVTYQ